MLQYSSTIVTSEVNKFRNFKPLRICNIIVILRVWSLISSSFGFRFYTKGLPKYLHHLFFNTTWSNIISIRPICDRCTSRLSKVRRCRMSQRTCCPMWYICMRCWIIINSTSLISRISHNSIISWNCRTIHYLISIRCRCIITDRLHTKMFSIRLKRSSNISCLFWPINSNLLFTWEATALSIILVTSESRAGYLLSSNFTSNLEESKASSFLTETDRVPKRWTRLAVSSW